VHAFSDVVLELFPVLSGGLWGGVELGMGNSGVARY